MKNIDITDKRLYDFLAEKNEQESTEEEYGDFYDDWAEEDIERWRD